MHLSRRPHLLLLITAYLYVGEAIKLPDEGEKTSGNITFSENPSGNGSDSQMGIVPRWIQARTTKVLERPLDSQLEFHEEYGTIVRNDDENEEENGRLRNRVLPFPPPIVLSAAEGSTGSVKQSSGIGGDGKVPVVRVAGVQKQNGKEQKISLKRKEPTRKQDIDLTAPLQFTHVVSPIEATLGGLSGLQGLPPLSFVQFSKLLVALTPFILPMIFIPTLIFTIGILMLPATRSNVFVDLDLGQRSTSGSPRHGPHSLMSRSSSLLSNYLVSPVKKFTGNVVMPRAYEFANDLIDQEECIERISCEISARYLRHNSWDGSWPSVANRGWIARTLNYLWGGANPTVRRIAKSLDILETSQNSPIAWRNSTSPEEAEKRGNIAANAEDDLHQKVVEPVLEFRRKNPLLTKNSPVACKRYTCQPKQLLKRFLPYN